eukprot:3431241-Pyramimonas_sp.AAC.1
MHDDEVIIVEELVLGKSVKQGQVPVRRISEIRYPRSIVGGFPIQHANNCRKYKATRLQAPKLLHTYDLIKCITIVACSL